MNCELFTVFDSAARRYLEPFCAPTVEVAIRMFRQLVNKAGHQFEMFPQDYVLFHVGSFDAEQGCIEGWSAPRSLGVALTFVTSRTDIGGDVSAAR